MPEIVPCSQLPERMLGGRGALPDFEAEDNPYGDLQPDGNRFRMALVWQELVAADPQGLGARDCPMVKHLCCDGWEGARCDVITCRACCVANGGRCTISGQCLCPNGKTGDCCQDDRPKPATLTGEGTLFSDQPTNSAAPFATCTHQSSLLRSWDGRSTKLRLACRYILASDGGDGAADDADGWSVEAQNVGCEQPASPNCRKKLWITLPGQDIRTDANHVTINGVALDDDKGHIEDGNGLNIQRDEAFTYLTTSLGLRLKWDTGANVHVTLDRELSGNAIGLCGVFDFNPKSCPIFPFFYCQDGIPLLLDDFTPFDSAPSESATDYSAFVSSFRSKEAGECSEESELDPCGSSARREEAESRCRVVQLDPAFRPAVDGGLDPAFFVEACMFDFCSLSGESEKDDEAIVCHYLTAFSLEAARFGIRLEGEHIDTLKNFPVRIWRVVQGGVDTACASAPARRRRSASWSVGRTVRGRAG